MNTNWEGVQFGMSTTVREVSVWYEHKWDGGFSLV